MNLLFFLVIRTELPAGYHEVLQVVTAFIPLLGVEISIETVEACIILLAFIVSTIASAYLFYIGLRAFRAGTVLQEAVKRHTHESTS